MARKESIDAAFAAFNGNLEPTAEDALTVPTGANPAGDGVSGRDMNLQSGWSDEELDAHVASRRTPERGFGTHEEDPAFVARQAAKENAQDMSAEQLFGPTVHDI